MPPKKLLIRGPVETVATTSPVEPLLPDPADVLVELQQAPEIRRTTVVLVMPPKFPVERFLLLIHRIMPDAHGTRPVIVFKLRRSRFRIVHT